MIEIRDPKVVLLGKFNCVTDAWKASRTHLSGKDIELHKLEELDLPVQGFAQYAFNIEGSIAFRELMYMLRPIQAWAYSYRTIDLQSDQIPLSSELSDRVIKSATKCNLKFLESKAAGIPQDLCKDELSYGTIVSFSMSVDLRTLSNVVRGLYKYAPHLYETYGREFERLVPEIKTTPGGDWILNDLGIQQSDLDALKNGPKKMGRMNVVGGKVGGSLHAQFIRKQYDKVYSSIVPLILSGEIYSMDQTAEFDAIIYMPDVSLKFLRSTRTCFFAMYDKESTKSWSSVIPVDHLSPDEFREQLPCGGDHNKCPFKTEQMARIIGGNTVDYSSKGEVNPPCPLLVGIKGTHDIRGLKFDSDSAIHIKWGEMLEGMDLEVTELGEEYLRNVNKYGFAEASDNVPEVRKHYLEILNSSVKRAKE